MFLSSSEGNGKPGLGSWNEERTDSSLYPVRGAAVTGVHNCIVRAHSALTLSVLLGMRLGYLGALGACLYSSLQSRVACLGYTAIVVVAAAVIILVVAAVIILVVA